MRKALESGISDYLLEDTRQESDDEVEVVRTVINYYLFYSIF